MRYRPAVIILAFAALLAVVQVSPTAAQTLGGVEQGLKPYGSYEGGKIDSISMVNGSLTLNIPLISYSERGGKLHVGFRLIYNNPWLQPLATNCDPYTKICTETGYNLVYYPSPSNCSATNPSGHTCGTAIGVSANFDYTLTPVYLSDGMTVKNYTVTDPDNAIHTLAPINASGEYRSLDTTGYLLTAPTSSPDGTGVLVDRRGNSYYFSNWQVSEIIDPNGNHITANENTQGTITSWTDTLGTGRAIPAPGASSTTDLSNCPSSATSATLWAPAGPNGGTSQFKFCSATIPISFTPPDCTGSLNCQATSTTATVIVGVVLPNLTAWTFSYDSFGEVTEITLPTGGTISYTWGYIAGTCVAPQYVEPITGFHTQLWPYRRAILSRTVDAHDGSGSHLWTYSGATGNGGQTIATDPLGNETVHTETALGGTCSIYETETDVDNGSTPLQKVVTSYNYYNGGIVADFGNVAINVVPYTITTTDLVSGKVSEVIKTYDSGVPIVNGTYNVVLGDLLNETFYDWGVGSPGNPLKTVNTTYEALSNSTYLSNNLLDLVASVQVLDGGGVQRAYTTYGYDEYALNSSGVTTQHTLPESSPGNQTSIHRWLNGSTTATTNCNVSVSNGYLVSYAVYNDTGTVDHSVDSCGSSASDTNHETSYAYSLTYAGAYPTTVTNPLGQSTTNTYDFNTGLLTSTIDLNGQPTSYAYDNMWRLSSVTYPDTGSVTITRQESSFPFSATLTKVLNASQSYVETNTFDGLGRVAHNEITSDPEGPVYTDTTYDALGRVASVSNPYRSTSDSTYGVTTTTQYDPLNRPEIVTKPDGSTVTTAYCGPTTLVTDEAGHWRRSTTDALGRLIEVDEPNSPTATVTSNGCPGTGEPIWVTTYGHDALGDLTSVVQGGSHNRNFSYDSLQHLISSINPESNANGTPTTYTYDADGNVITKTDARAITSTYSYDVLNRATGVTYSNGDPSIAYAYDQATSGCYNVGRRTSMTDAGGSEILCYDKMGREWREQRTTNGVPETTTYTYDLAGDLTTLKYPSGRTITYTYDSAERPSDAIDVADGINYVSGPCANGASSPITGACYAPQGAVAEIQDGSNLVSTDIYNDRLQPCWMYATTGSPLATNTSCTASDPGPANILDLQYSYNLSSDNGNVIGIANNRDTTRSQSFAYDQVNRITSALTSSTSGANCWGENYSYDEWANLESIGIASGYSCGNQEGSWSATATANNQLPTSIMTYDAAGNTLTDNFNIYQWNAAGEMSSGATVNYTYDGDGNRVEKSNGKIYWYGAGTEILDESDLSGNFTNEYVYFAGKRVARLDPTTGYAATPGTGSATISGSEQSISGAPATAGTGSVTFSGTLQSKQVQTKAATAGTGSVTFSGTLQSKQVQTQPATAATGSVTISGTEQSMIPCYHCAIIYDSGTVSIIVNGHADSVNYGSTSTSSSIASGLVSAINGDSGAPVTASLSGSTVYLTSKATGASANYSLSTSVTWNTARFSHASFSASPSGSTLTGGTDATYTTLYDSGTSTITVNGHSDSVSWSGAGTTASSIASALASAINGDGGAPESASVSGSTVYLTAKTTGASTNYSLSSSWTYDSTDFSGSSFTSSNSGSTLTGGADAVYTTVYDSGTSTITVNGHGDSTSWSGSGTTASSIASALASSINGDSGASVSASVSGSTVYLTAKTTGASTNYSLSSSSTYDSNNFSSPSFTSSNSGSTLTGGHDQGATTYDSGTVWVTINGVQYSTSYGEGNTTSTVASALTNAINADGTAVVTASVSGSTITLTAKNGGANTDYSLSAGSSTTQGSFSSPSFTISTSGSTLAGGGDASIGTIYYYVEDMLGSSRTIVQAGQSNSCFDADFYPYGGEHDVTDSCPQNYKFEGKERDSETQNDDFGSRYYTWRLGRWLSADWSAIPAPVPYANLTNPQTLNLYAMVGDNPETFADLNGHSPEQGGGTLEDGTNTCSDADPHCLPAQQTPEPSANDQQAQNTGWSLSWQVSASANFLGQELVGVADATVLPVVNAAEHPIDTLEGIGNAVEHPVDTAKAMVNGAVDTAKAAASGDPRAIGQVAGVVISTAAGVRGAQAAGEEAQGLRVVANDVRSGPRAGELQHLGIVNDRGNIIHIGREGTDWHVGLGRGGGASGAGAAVHIPLPKWLSNLLNP